MNPPAILRILQADDVALALETIDRNRHRRGGHAHVRGEVHHRRRLDFIEMVEDAGLVAAEQALRVRIADVPRVTRKVDAWIERHHRGHRGIDGGHVDLNDMFICFVKAIYFSVSYCKPAGSGFRPIVRFP